MKEAPSDARWVITDFLGRPRNWTPKAENDRQPLHSSPVQNRVSKKSFGSYINGNTYKEEFLEVGYLEKNWNLIILYKI